jgi:hypothetical protein
VNCLLRIKLMEKLSEFGLSGTLRMPGMTTFAGIHATAYKYVIIP